ncbi:uncharacterized protein UV8b_07552 [Ustilaginoidea virens]|uniref:Uncharacterized protein n=1 Tax=Ustilaginoidea virens TaxID=1159556 RepID=A0A8E5MKQ2_USTVR|nr:uncharacterized protein UV8b_07552 [Ustilaginoidea virens]QUC23311.1 hypothetical protein UV8b_07552 [Ustilaginoidea virens]
MVLRPCSDPAGASRKTDGAPVKAEEPADRPKSGYKSWKKKYRKMRIVFDHKMQQGEDLHKREAKAAATVKRLAVENDRLLDLLLDVNSSPQIPLDKRVDVSLRPGAAPARLVLPADREHAARKQLAVRRLESLLQDIPHLSFGTARDARSSYVADLAAPEGEAYPGSFLSADDVDNYIHDVDSAMDPETHIPTLAPRAHPNPPPLPHPHLKNPTSVTNWLRKHAPKIFLQDGEGHDGGGGGGGGGDDDGHHHHHHHHAGHHAGGRKTRAGRGERGRGRGRGKRASLASRAAERDRGADWDASMDDDADFGAPVARGKRKRDDDRGYRPGGSATRPVKKKRRSDVDAGPAVKKSKKEATGPKRED